MSTFMAENGRKIHAKKENCFELTCETRPFAEPTSCVSSSYAWLDQGEGKQVQWQLTSFDCPDIGRTDCLYDWIGLKMSLTP